MEQPEFLKGSYDNTDFNQLLKEAEDFLLIVITPHDENSHMMNVNMKNPTSIVHIITAILMENEQVRQEVMTNIMTLQMHKSKDKTIN